MGVFGGKYMTDCRDEFPDEWFEEAKLSPQRRDPELNFFGVDASKPLSYWREKGWIWEKDPRGWFQWYCRVYLGRRSTDDNRQVRRALGVMGPKVTTASQHMRSTAHVSYQSQLECLVLR